MVRGLPGHRWGHNNNLLEEKNHLEYVYRKTRLKSIHKWNSDNKNNLRIILYCLFNIKLSLKSHKFSYWLFSIFLTQAYAKFGEITVLYYSPQNTPSIIPRWPTDSARYPLKSSSSSHCTDVASELWSFPLTMGTWLTVWMSWTFHSPLS